MFSTSWLQMPMNFKRCWRIIQYIGRDSRKTFYLIWEYYPKYVRGTDGRIQDSWLSLSLTLPDAPSLFLCSVRILTSARTFATVNLYLPTFLCWWYGWIRLFFILVPVVKSLPEDDERWKDWQITDWHLFDCLGSGILYRTNSCIPLISTNCSVVNEILRC